jgi:small subunit ribosomal protein S6
VKEYEGIFIIDPELGEDRVKAEVAKLKEMISKNKGKAVREEKLEKKALSYEIKKRREGYYLSIDFSAPPKAVATLKRSCNLEEGILRHLILCK